MKIKNIKPIKYITLLQKYNALETKYEVLESLVKNKCFEDILSKVSIPEQLQQRDKTIKRLKKQNEALKETIKLIKDDK